jgi:hypothetical protein
MKFRGISPERRRVAVWAVGAAVMLGCYFVNAIQLPRQTPVGVERRICGIGQQTVVLKESPSGRQWLLILAEEPSPTAGSAPGSLSSSAPFLQELQWPGNTDTVRRLAPFVATGTWQLRDHALRRVWNLGARGWLDEEHLWLSSENGWPPSVWILDLTSGRTVDGRWPEVERLDEADNSSGDFTQKDWEPDLWSTLSSGLEELPPDFNGAWKYGHDTIGDRGVYLVHTLAAGGEPVALYAVSSETAPRILRLASRARPLALSRDGRTLFFQREGVLWRLDLRKPLPALLDEVPVPELPDALALR